MPQILVVDDHRLTRSVTVHLFERAGVSAGEAASGREALRRLAGDGGIHTLVTDVLMPDMDGLELIQAARRLRPDLRIVAMSAGGNRVTLDLLPVAQFLGADAVFHKPIDQAKVALVLGAPPPVPVPSPVPSGAAAGAAEDAELGAVAMVERHGA